MNSLSLHRASKRYGDTLVLDAVDVVFPQGRITAVIGPSGCGKSTLLKLCNGLELPDSGEVAVFGQAMDYANLPRLRRRLGYAVQGTGLFPHMTAKENITLLARLEAWPRKKIEQRLAELLELSELEAAQVERHPHQLSGGQQQRVGLCRALMLKPEILLLDEPFAAVDPLTRAEIHRRMLDLQRAAACTTVLVTHDMREALTLADHLVIMREGQIIHSQSRDQLLSLHPGAEPETMLRELLARELA
jgi:osmoprotectant transport system ATP-binding protein